MSWPGHALGRLVRREEGQDMVEYALITAVVAVMIGGIAWGLLVDAFNAWVANVANLVSAGSA